ncbi:MAG: hypothetical protein ABT01_08450 [Clostridium sp. SCN 57-10]|nr:MAG: hypothetical protein ABT01_08450 [Clostridium sp. SCN 57-10]
MKPTHIIWDWNGTLLDDVDASVDIVNDILRAQGRGETTLAEYHAMMEMPIIRYYEKLFDLRALPFERIVRAFNEGYARRSAQMHLADGAREALARFAADGCVQVILSSFEKTRLRAAVHAKGVEPYFAEILGADDLRAESKESRARAWQAKSGARPEHTLVIGDLVHDGEVAHALGAQCILTCSGHQPRSALETCGFPVAQSLTQLFDFIA